MLVKNMLVIIAVFAFSVSALAQDKAFKLSNIPPLERAIICIKYFEGWHSKEHYPYIGYGHKLLPGEKLTYNLTEKQADSLLRVDILKRYMTFKKYGKDALLLAVLSYNVGEYRLLGYSNYPKSKLLQKIEAGDRNIYNEYLSFCRYKGKF
jgi:Phage-related lysozyme (muraminidase)